MYIHHFWHIVSVQSCVTSQTPAGTYVYLVCTCLVSWVERLPCTLLWPSYLCILCYPLIMPKCWSVAHTRPFSNVCCRNQHLITVAFQYCKAWPYPVNLPRLARGPGSHLGKWKIQAVPGKNHGRGAMIKRRARRSHTWDTHQQWLKSKELRHS